MISSPRALSLSLLIHGCIIAATVGVVFHHSGGGGGESTLAFQSKGGSLVQAEEPAGQDTPDLGQPQESVSPPAAAVLPAPDMPEPTASDLVVPVESKVVTALPTSPGTPTPEAYPVAEGPAKKTTARKRTGAGTKGTGEASATRGGGGEGSGGGDGGGPAWVPARYNRCPAPAYPAAAKKGKLEGQVLLLVLVDENGRPASISLRHSSGSPVLDEAAVAAVGRWRFEPAKQNGKSVSSRVEVPVRFVAS